MKDSNYEIHQLLWNFMSSKENVQVQSYNEGIEKVLQEDGKYALFAESTVVDYIVDRRCDLKQVGGLLNSKSYGIGLPKSKPFKLYINFI